MEIIKVIISETEKVISMLPISPDIGWLIIGVLVLVAGISLLEEAKKVVSWVLILAGIYAFVNGLVDLQTLLTWRPFG